MSLTRANGFVAAVLGAAALTTAGMGCELITSVDRNLIPGTGGGGGAPITSSTGTGGVTTTATTTTSSTGTGGATTSTTTTSSTVTSGTTTSGTTTSSTGTGGMGTGGGVDAGIDAETDAGIDAETDAGTDAGTCTATEKTCNGACVAIDDPRFGCGTTTCSPCAAADQCHTMAACNSTTDQCTYVPVTDGTPCNDSNACTQTDVCTAGVCAGTPVTCAPSDQCHTAGTCNTSTGVCTNPPGANNTPCNDGNACTNSDVCTGGTCAGTAYACAAADQCHQAGTCNGDGTCSFANLADNTSCNDGNACTNSDVCTGGTCAGRAYTCAAADQCHQAGTCNGDGTCSFANLADNTTCDDGNACTNSDVCTGGTCAGTAYTCTAPDQCHQAGTCNGDGTCSFANLADNTACTDAAECGLIGSCQAGACTGPCSSGLCGTSLSAFTGIQTPAWSFNGNAHYDSGTNTAVLVDGTVTSGQAGTVIYQDAITADTFTVTFDFLMSTSGQYSRADGIAFMIAMNGSTALGKGFGGFGVLDLNGYGAELDIFDSNTCDPGNGNHAGIDVLSECGSNNGIPTPIATSDDLYTPVDGGDNGVGDLGDGQWRTATVTLANSQLSVSITDPSTGSPVAVPFLQNVALPSFVPGTPYFFGFGAGSGSQGNAARQEIKNVAVTFGTTRCL